MARGKIPFDVFLYVPNLIGYTRIVCMLIAFAASLRSWKVFLVCYALAFAGDAVDGLAARKFDQSSKFGGVLDGPQAQLATFQEELVKSKLSESGRMRHRSGRPPRVSAARRAAEEEQSGP